MGLIEINKRPSDRQLRQFATLVLPLAGLLLAVLLWWRFGQTGAAWAVAAAVAAVAVGGWLRPALARPIYLGWMYAAAPVGWVLGHVILCAVFFLVVTPVGLWMRVAGRDPLQRQFDASSTSYWEPRTPSERARYFRQF